MSYYPIALEDQETVISFSRTCDVATVWTTDRTMMNKLDKLCEKSPSNYECFDVGRYVNDKDQIMDKSYYISDKTLISFRSAKVHRELTDEQKREVAERLRGSKFA